MSEVTSPGGFYSSDVQRRDSDMGTGMVTFGDVSISATDAAEFVMMHRTQVMKSIGADRTEMAQQHLERIQTARRYLTDLTDLQKFCDNAHSHHDRIPVTPDMVDFLKNEVGCSPGESEKTLMWTHWDAVPRLPESVRDYYGFGHNGWGTGGHFEYSDSHHYEMSDVTVVDEDDMDFLKENVNNYIDQQNDGNNLFMTKFKSVINSMNEALEGASSMADKSHDTLKNLLSRW